MSYYAKNPKEKLLDILHHDNAMGRELHALALEFYMLNAENPVDRLIHTIFLMDKTKNCLPFKDKWLTEAQNIRDEYIKLKYQPYGNEVKKNIKQAEYKSCNHLDEFVKKIDGFIKNNGQDENVEKIIPLRNYLKFHIEKEGSIENEEDTDKFINTFLDEMTHLHCEDAKCRLHGKGEDVRCFRMLLVSRHITGGFYELEEEGSQIEKFNPVSLMTGKTYWRWSKEPIDKIIKEKKCAYPY